MSSFKLLEPLLEEGIRSTNFFNGRVLSAEDLKVDQGATRSRDRLLGRALGAGVVGGLKVGILQSSGTVPILTISDGLAISQDGEVLELPSSVELELAQVNTTSANSSSASPFVTCGNPSTSTAPTGTGSYVLVMGPASGLEGKAPVSTLSGAQADVCCRSRNVVEGVTFNLIRINPNNLSTTYPKLNRNLLAHYCFGTSGLIANAAKQALSSPETYEYSPLVKEKKIPSSQVPLAVISWSSSGLDFIDLWAVRRPLVPELEAPWQFLTGARRQAEALSMLHQFQDQLDTLRLGKSSTSVSLKDYFRYLPSLGIVPLAVTTRDTSGNITSATAGFDQVTFFNGVPVQDVITLPPASLRAILLAALYFDPFDLNSVIQNQYPLTLIQLQGVTSYVIFTRPIGFVPEVIEDDTSGSNLVADGDTKNARIVVNLSASRGSIAHLISAQKEALAAGKAKEKQTYAYFAGARAGGKIPGTEKPGTEKPGTSSEDPLSDSVKVWAEDKVGTAHPGKFGRGNAASDTSLRYDITSLKAGVYTVVARVSGFKESRKPVTLTSGQVLTLNIQLVPARQKPPRKPPAGKTTGDLKERGIDKVVVVDQPRWPYPPEEDWNQWDRVLPGEDLRTYLEGWGDYVSSLSPEASVDQGDLFVAIAPGFEAGTTTEGPYAFVVFGESGASVPILLVSAEQSLGREVSLSEAGLTGLDAHTVQELSALGLDSVDALGAAWSGLVADTLQVSTTAAQQTIASAKRSTQQLRTRLSGSIAVDAAAEKVLSESMGFTDVAQLAKADPAALQKAFAQQGVSVDAGYSLRLVDAAKKVSSAKTTVRGGTF